MDIVAKGMSIVYITGTYCIVC